MFKPLKKMALIAFIGLLAACGNSDEQQQQQGMPVKVGNPIIQKLTEWDEYTGRFRASKTVELRARVSGYLEQITFKDGQDVQEGDTLFIIDQRPFKIALERAEASYELANKEYQRSKNLRKSSAVSQQEVDVRYQELRTAKAALDDAKLNLEFTEVKAPIKGRVSRHLVDVGNLVTGGDVNATLLTTIVSQDPIYFYFEASEQEVLKYTRLDKEGTRESSRYNERSVFVKLQDEVAFVREGKINFVDNAFDSGTGTLQARAEFSNPDGTLLPGIFGRLRIAGSGEYEAMLVPDDVIGTNQSVKFVYVVGDKNMLEARPVELGPLHDNNMRIIRSGLKKDDQVVMAGITILRPGMPVTPMPIDAPAPTSAAASAPEAKAEATKEEPKTEPKPEAKVEAAPAPVEKTEAPKAAEPPMVTEVKKLEAEAPAKPTEPRVFIQKRLEEKPVTQTAPATKAQPKAKPAPKVDDAYKPTVPEVVEAPAAAEPLKLEEPKESDAPKVLETPKLGLSDAEIEAKIEPKTEEKK